MKILSTAANQSPATRNVKASIYSDRNVHNQIVALSAEKAKRIYGASRKKRGRKAATIPNNKHLEILEGTRTKTYAEVGTEFNISRQRVAQIVGRWKQYLPIRSLRAREFNSVRPVDQFVCKKERRIHIVSFRLTDSEVKTLQARYPEMKSADRAARGIVTRFLSL